MPDPAPRAEPAASGLAAVLWRRPRLRLSLLLAGPVGWLVVAYLGSLAILFVASLWRLDSFSGEIVQDPGFQNFQELVETPVYRSIVLRTLLIATLVTLTDAILALPIAFYMAKVATPRVRALLVVAVLMPLWASYLVKVYSWRVILSQDGILNWALERIPQSLIDASFDPGAAPARTFRRVILPLAFPAVVAGSIFTFSLTLGDYITPSLVSPDTQFIGNVVFTSHTNNLPLASAFATVPIVVMVVYLLIARRLGAFEHL